MAYRNRQPATLFESEAQRDLFDPDNPYARGLRPAASRSSDPDTSRQAAAELAASGVQGKQAQAVLDAVRKWTGRTSAELAQLAGLDRYAVARRLPELERADVVRKCPPRKCAIQHRAATTWAAVELPNHRTGNPK